MGSIVGTFLNDQVRSSRSLLNQKRLTEARQKSKSPVVLKEGDVIRLGTKNAFQVIYIEDVNMFGFGNSEAMEVKQTAEEKETEFLNDLKREKSAVSFFR